MPPDKRIVQCKERCRDERGFICFLFFFFLFKLFIIHKDNCKMSFLEAMLNANWILKSNSVKVLTKSANAMTKIWRCDRTILILFLQVNYL